LVVEKAKDGNFSTAKGTAQAGFSNVHISEPWVRKGLSPY
jgi:hypothetical protein